MPKGKAFKGFSDTQMKRIAQKLGYTGKIGQFRDFLKSNPALAAKYNALENMARMKFAEGGAVQDPNQQQTEQQPQALAPETAIQTAQAMETPQAVAPPPPPEPPKSPEGVTTTTMPTPGTAANAPAVTGQIAPVTMQEPATQQQPPTTEQPPFAPGPIGPMSTTETPQAVTPSPQQQQQEELAQAPEPQPLPPAEATEVTQQQQSVSFQNYMNNQQEFMSNYLNEAPEEIRALPGKMEEISNQLNQKYGEQAKALNMMFDSKYTERINNATTQEEREAISAEIQADAEFQNARVALETAMENDPLVAQGREMQQQYGTYMQRGIDQFAANNPPPTMTDVAVDRMENPQLPTGGKLEANKITEESNQIIDETAGQVSGAVPGATTGAVATATADTPDDITASKATTSTVEADVKAETDALTAAQGTVSEKAQITAAETAPTTTKVGTVPSAQIANAATIEKPASRTLQSGEQIDAAANARTASNFIEEVGEATADPTKNAMVKGQLENLMADFDDGQTPAWAAGAIRNANAILAARGLSSSSMAGQAIVQATMEAALPIAQADAATQAQFEAQNLSNRQARAMLSAEHRAKFMGMEFDQEFQARVQNAAKISDIANMNFTAEQQIAIENAKIANTVDLANLDSNKAMALAEAAQIANLETANLDNRQQAAVQNAKSFLDMDMANLEAEQQTAIFKSQQNIQAMLSDQAAENATSQFNATSENQTKQFMANLESQINQYNATQTNAMAQYNENNAIDVQKFNSQMKEARDQFNANNQLVVKQSNAQWRRDIATENNATINAVNEFNAKAVLDISEQAYDNLWQTYSDVMEYAWKSGENERDRINELMRQQLANDGAIDIAAIQASASDNQALGGFFSRALFGSNGIFGF